MPISVSDNFQQWLVNKNLQGFIKVEEAEPHPCAAEILQQINVSKITNKKVRSALEFKRECFDAVQKMDKDVLRSYVGDYSPSTKPF